MEGIVIKNKYAAFVLFVVVVLLFWNILDYLYSAFITHSQYSFSASGDLMIPLAPAIVVGYMQFLRKKDK